MTDVLIRKEVIWIQTCTQGERHVKMKTAIEMVLLQAKGHQRLPANPQELGERHRTDPPAQPSEGTIPANTLILAS